MSARRLARLEFRILFKAHKIGGRIQWLVISRTKRISSQPMPLCKHFITWLFASSRPAGMHLSSGKILLMLFYLSKSDSTTHPTPPLGIISIFLLTQNQLTWGLNYINKFPFTITIDCDVIRGVTFIIITGPTGTWERDYREHHHHGVGILGPS